MRTVDKHRLASQLDTLAEQVSGRQIYVIQRTANGINIVDYANKSVKLNGIPTAELADYLCNKLNFDSKRTFNFDRIQTLFDRYNRLMCDTEFYRHTIKITSSNVKKEVVAARLDVTVNKLKHVVEEIKKSC